MFTGLIEDLGQVLSIESHDKGAVLLISTQLDPEDIRLGDSIAVHGACLTVIRKTESSLAFDLSTETMHRTMFSDLKVGAQVHLERALRFGERLDGHLVQGHIDGTAELVQREPDGEGHVLHYRLPPSLLPQVVEKGSIAINGVSLTIASLRDPIFTVAIIPHTAAHTCLVQDPIGQSCNIETDILAKYVQRLAESHLQKKDGLSKAFLDEHGFA